MNIVGTWVVDQVKGRDEADNIVMLNAEEYKKFLVKCECSEETIAERMMAFGRKVRFTEDNFVEMLMPIPEGTTKEEIDDAVASGDVKIVDGMMAMCSPDPDDAMKWKEEDGQFFTTEGFNFETNEMSWAKIDVVDDNSMDFMLFRIVRE